MALRPWSRLRENLLHFIRFAKVSRQSKVTQVFAFYPLQEESFGDLNSQASGVTQPRSPQASAPYKAGTRLHRNMSQRRRNKSSIEKYSPVEYLSGLSLLVEYVDTSAFHQKNADFNTSPQPSTDSHKLPHKSCWQAFLHPWQSTWPTEM